MNQELAPQEYIPELRTMAIPVNFFALYWKPIALVSIVVLAGLTFWWQQNRIDHYRNLYDKEKLVTEVLAKNVVTLETAITEQNKSIQEAVEKSKRLDKILLDLEDKLKDMRKKSNADKDKDLARPAPKNEQEIIDLIKETMEYIKWEN